VLKFPENLSEARILISNDDSIHSDGIKVLEDIVRTITPNVWVVAPENQQSAVGHSLTIHMPLRIREYDARHFSVYGTPTDSVLMGAGLVMKEFRPHLVLSGINHGQNTADDVTYSGTIAAAIEATLMKIPAVAFSQDYNENGGRPNWDIARQYLPGILKSMQGMEWDDNVLISINLPEKHEGMNPEVRVVPQGHYSMEKQDMVKSVDPRGRPYYWIGAPPARDELDQKMDVGSLKAGHITVTPLALNLTHHPTLQKLHEVFK
jgi:5'-nucleotidase